MSFKQELTCFSFTCSTQSEELTEKLKHSNKILLPPSILYKLNQNEELENTDIMFFKISNKELQYGIVCGVQEFSAPPGICHIPYHIMNTIGVAEGSTVEIEKVCPVQGQYMKLRPHKTEFIKLSNPKAVLERIMSSEYPVVSQGQTIEIYHKELGKLYLIDIIEAGPAEIISIVNTDINIDFEQPLDYVEPTKITSREAKLKSMRNPVSKQFVPFSGQGRRLGAR